MGDIQINEHRVHGEEFMELRTKYPMGEYNGTLHTLWYQVNVKINDIDVEFTWFLDDWNYPVKTWLLENHQDTWSDWNTGLIMKYDEAIEPTTGTWGEEE